MSAYYAYRVLHRSQYLWLDLHAFIVLHSTYEISNGAEQIFRIFCNRNAKNTEIERECELNKFEKIILPTWIDEKYLDFRIKNLPTILLDNKSIEQKEIFKFATRFPYFQPQTPEMDKIKLKVKFLLLIHLGKKILQQRANGNEEITKPVTEKQIVGPSQGGSLSLFPQPSAWCDDGADEGPAESARVCCRCGMCPGVVEKTDLLVYHTAPPTHPLLDTCSTHPLLNTCSTHPFLNTCSTHFGYSVPSRFVFAPAATQGMVPGTQAQQVYILRL